MAFVFPPGCGVRKHNRKAWLDKGGMNTAFVQAPGEERRWFWSNKGHTHKPAPLELRTENQVKNRLNAALLMQLRNLPSLSGMDNRYLSKKCSAQRSFRSYCTGQADLHPAGALSLQLTSNHVLPSVLGGEQRTEGMCPRCHPLSEAGSEPALPSSACKPPKTLL